MAIKAFLDANIYFAAARSPLGGSGFVLELAKKGKLEVFITREVLKEAERNLRLKEDVRVLVRYYENLKFTKLKIITIDKGKAKKKFEKIINEKDALVLAGAGKSKVDYLVTLDRKHFFTNKMRLARLPFKIVTPGQLIEELSA